MARKYINPNRDLADDVVLDRAADVLRRRHPCGDQPHIESVCLLLSGTATAIRTGLADADKAANAKEEPPDGS